MGNSIMKCDVDIRKDLYANTVMSCGRRRSPPWPPPPSRSRSLLPQRGSTPSGSEAPSWLPSPPSSRCGSPSRSTTSAAPPSSTGSASKRFSISVQRIHSFYISISSHSTKHNFNLANVRNSLHHVPSISSPLKVDHDDE